MFVSVTAVFAAERVNHIHIVKKNMTKVQDGLEFAVDQGRRYHIATSQAQELLEDIEINSSATALCHFETGTLKQSIGLLFSVEVMAEIREKLNNEVRSENKRLSLTRLRYINEHPPLVLWNNCAEGNRAKEDEEIVNAMNDAFKKKQIIQKALSISGAPKDSVKETTPKKSKISSHEKRKIFFMGCCVGALGLWLLLYLKPYFTTTLDFKKI